MRFPFGFSTRILSAFLACSVAACAVGPDFKRPDPPRVDRYTAKPLPQDTAALPVKQGAAQHFNAGAPTPEAWWRLFGSEELNRLMEEAMRANPDVLSALAALRAASEQAEAERSVFWPSVSASFAPTRERFNAAAFGTSPSSSGSASVFTLYNASVNASYTLDVFGGNRRQVELTDAQADDARYQAEAAYLSLTSNIVTAAIQSASLREQIRENEHTVAIETKELQVLQSQFQLGGIAKSTVLEQEATLAQTEATLPPLRTQLAQTQSQLALLAGKTAAEESEHVFTLSSLRLPENLPVALPSKLVEQRPDILQAEASLHQASAEIGVVTAEMLPQLSLSASYGVESILWPKLFRGDSLVWDFGANLLQPIFKGGLLIHQKRAAVAAFEQALMRYRSVVLQAFKNVGDSMLALRYDADTLASDSRAEQAASKGLELARDQYKDGAISYPQLLDTERTYQQTRIALVQARAARLADTAALFQSLGGGWWTKTDTETLAKPHADTKNRWEIQS